VTGPVRATLDVAHAGCGVAEGTQLGTRFCDNEGSLHRSISLATENFESCLLNANTRRIIAQKPLLV